MVKQRVEIMKMVEEANYNTYEKLINDKILELERKYDIGYSFKVINITISTIHSETYAIILYEI